MFRGILWQTFRVAITGRMMYLFGMAGLVAVGYLFVVDSVQVFGDKVGFDPGLAGVRAGASGLASVLIFFAVFSLSRLFPSMFNPGMAGFYLSKPLSRTRLLSYTLLSGMIVYTGVIMVVLLSYGMAQSALDPERMQWGQFLAQMSLECAVFLVYAPILVLLGVMTNSGSFAFLGGFGIWFVASILRERTGALMFLDSDALRLIADALYYLLPKSSGITNLVTGESAPAYNWMPLWTSTLTAIAAYLFSLIKFQKQDY